MSIDSWALPELDVRRTPVGTVRVTIDPLMTPTQISKPAPMHGCLRCGRDVALEIALCEECNPLGLKQPAATQVHALAAGGIFLFVVFLAVIGRFAIGGIGPFTGEVRGVVAATGGLEVTIAVRNAGSTASSTTCRVVEASRPVGGPAQLLQTPNIGPGQTLEFSAPVSAFGAELQDLAVDCQSPRR